MRTCAICGAESNMLLCYAHWINLTTQQKIQCGRPMSRAEKKIFVAEIKAKLGLT